MGKILVIGSLNMDYVIGVEEMPKAGQTILGKSLQLIPGGKGANQAFAAGKLGSEVSMIGAVGDDDNGAALTENLKSVGVDTSGIAVISNQNTGAAFISVNQRGENCITVILGANNDVTPELVERSLHLIDECDIVLFQLEIPMETIIYASRIAKDRGKTVILDPAPAPKFLPVELLQNVDIIKPNETELETLSGVKIDDSIDKTDDISKAANILIERGAKVVIVTLGKRGAIIVSKEMFIHSAPVESGKVVDTTAAGDCFTAAFASSMIKGSTFDEAAHYANSASSIAVTRKGAQSSMPTAEEVSKLI